MNWILEDEAPHIKYRTMIELQGRDKDEVEVKQTLDKLLASNELRLIMDKFQMKSKWEHINALLALVEFGLTRNEVNIDEHVEQLIKKLNKGMK